MTHAGTVLSAFFVIFLIFSCKQEGKESAPPPAVSEAIVVNKTVEDTTLLSEEKVTASLYEKIKTIPELHSFQQRIKGTELQEFLQLKKGPFTVFALPNDVFKDQRIDSPQTPTENDSVIAVLHGLISDKKVTSIDLIQGLKKKNILLLSSFSEENIEVSRHNFEIFITTGMSKGRLGKTDIEASNGVLHIIDSVWSKR